VIARRLEANVAAPGDPCVPLALLCWTNEAAPPRIESVANPLPARCLLELVLCLLERLESD
jgi:hypothetical protein